MSVWRCDKCDFYYCEHCQHIVQCWYCRRFFCGACVEWRVCDTCEHHVCDECDEAHGHECNGALAVDQRQGA